MVWILAFFTLFGVNFTIWTIIGLFRLATEKADLKVNRFDYGPHSFLRWVSVFVSPFRLKIIFRHFFKTLKKKVNWTIIDILKFSPNKFKLAFSKNKYPSYFLRSWVIKFLKISGTLIIYRVVIYFPKKLIRKVQQRKNKNNNLPNFIPLAKKQIEMENKNNYEEILVEEVAAIIPAHNEEMTISKTINSLIAIMPVKNIYVGSDASTDRTLGIVERLGCNVIDIRPNKGKAGVLTYLIKYFRLLTRYKAIIIVDADSVLDENYFKEGLPLFKDKEVVAVAAHVKSKWKKHFPPKWSMIFTAYRVRLYRILQAVMRYGQTWKYTNVTLIIPGFASMYRTSALKNIKINAPGLIIEDYNMTFEIHHNKLGKIAYHPKVFALSQDPITFQDYFKQVKRWNLGFWQTFRRHGLWPSLFSFATTLYMIEMVFYGIFFLIVPLILCWFMFTSFAPIPLPFEIPIIKASELKFIDILVGIFLIDYIITIIVSIFEKKPILMIYGLAFIILRYLDAFIFLYTLPLTFAIKSDGRWVSPERHLLTQET